MPKYLNFQEPDRCDYLYVDDQNRVHLLIPLVGGEGIATDNTCKTAMELKSFFYGSYFKSSATKVLVDYQTKLKEDINAIEAQRYVSPLAYKELLQTKKKRLEQIENYIQLIQVIKKDFDKDKEIHQLQTEIFPNLPTAISELIKDSQNAFVIRLAPDQTDSYTRLDNPLFELKRNRSALSSQGFSRLEDGLGTRLRNVFQARIKTNVLVNKKSPKEELVKNILARTEHSEIKAKLYDSAQKLKIFENEENFNVLRGIIQEELINVDPRFTVEKMAYGNAAMTLGAVVGINYFDEKESLEDWIKSILSCGVPDESWSLSSGIFYEDLDSKFDRCQEEFVDMMALKVQFMLGEINIYCKANQLSDINFGVFFDSEPHASNISQLVMEALSQGIDVEPVIYKYINNHHTDLGLSKSLSTEQQQEITVKFNSDYSTIKESPHFDEFLIMDPSKKSNVYSHHAKMTCHFLDFFARHTQGTYPLPESLATHASNLNQEISSAQIHHRNELVAKGHLCVQQFRAEVMRLLANNKPKELIHYLVAKSPSGVPNYSMLSLETQNLIAFSKHWPKIEKYIANSSETEKYDLTQLLSRSNLTQENRTVIAWESISKKPLVEIELEKIAKGLNDTVTKYQENRSQRFFKSSTIPERRKKQCNQIQETAADIRNLVNDLNIPKDQWIDKIMKSIKVLDQIDKNISKEWNLLTSDLQLTVRDFRNQLKELCASDLKFESDNVLEMIKNEMEKQLEKIVTKEVRDVVEKLPTYCHTDTAIDFFNTLSPQEALKIASYVKIHYLDFNSSLNKDELLANDIPNLFKEINQKFLAQLESRDIISQDLVTKLSISADKISPELFTENNIRAWSTDIELLEQSKHCALLVQVSNIMALIHSGDQRAIKDKLTELEALSAQLEKTTDRDNLTGSMQDKLIEFESTLKVTINSAKSSPAETKTITLMQEIEQEHGLTRTM